MKEALYPNLMFLETAIKNIVCNESVQGLKHGTFDYVFKERMNDNSANTKLQSNRLRLRNSVYSKLSSRYNEEDKKDNQMVRHFYNKGEDVPLWVVFEILYLSELASFFGCLNTTTRETILKQLDMFDVSIDTNRNLLSSMLYTIKVLRNAVAHNNVIFDSRFKDRNINAVLKKWTEKETGIQNITLYSLIDYIIIICCILKRIDFSEAKSLRLVETLKNENERLKNAVDASIYDMIVQKNIPAKISALEVYLSK